MMPEGYSERCPVFAAIAEMMVKSDMRIVHETESDALIGVAETTGMDRMYAPKHRDASPTACRAGPGRATVGRVSTA
jgi:hypothetical protein